MQELLAMIGSSVPNNYQKSKSFILKQLKHENNSRIGKRNRKYHRKDSQ